MSNRELVVAAAIDVLGREERVMKGRELGQRLREELPDVDRESIKELIWRLPQLSLRIEKAGCSRYKLRSPEATQRLAGEQPVVKRERMFYPALAEYLRELEELDGCAALGGSLLGDPYGTPDAMGTRGAGGAPYVVSAEVKTSTYTILPGFGQACAYKLFSHRAYLAVPRAARFSALAYLERLCVMQDVGLIVFDSSAPHAPCWELRVRPRESTPDSRMLQEKVIALREVLAKKA